MLLDSEQIRSIPVLGSMIEERSRKTVPRARRYVQSSTLFREALPHYAMASTRGSRHSNAGSL